MDILLSRWTPYFNYYWPHLEILHNPSCKVHWIKALCLLRDTRIEGAECPLQPCLIIAAARYGLARISRRPALGEIALDDLLDPRSHRKWDDLCDEEDEVLEELVDKARERYADTIWRPRSLLPISPHQVYEDVDALLRLEGAEDLAEDQDLVFEYLDDLVDEHRRIYNTNRRIRRERLGIRFAAIDVQTLDETDSTCYICYESFLDPHTYLLPLAKAARHQPFLAILGSEFLNCPPYVDVWTYRLKINYRRIEHDPDGWDTMIIRDLRRFTYGMISARHRFMNLISDSPLGGCSYPVELSCGHFFGFPCITTWLEDHWTCPYCRADLRTKRPAVQMQPTPEPEAEGSSRRAVHNLFDFHAFLPQVTESPAIIRQVTDLALSAIAGRPVEQQNSILRSIVERLGFVDAVAGVLAIGGGSQPYLVEAVDELVQGLAPAEEAYNADVDEDSQVEGAEEINPPSPTTRRLMNRAVY